MFLRLWPALLVRLVVRCRRGLAVGAEVVLGWLLVQQGGVAVSAEVVGDVAVAGALLGAAVWVSGRLAWVVSGQAREERARAEDRAAAVAGVGVVPPQRALGAR